MKKNKILLLTIVLLLAKSVCIVTTSFALSTTKQHQTWGKATFQLIKNKGDLDAALNALSKENPDLSKCIKAACSSKAMEGTSNGMKWKKNGSEFLEITYAAAKYSMTGIRTALIKYFKYVQIK